ncbi:MAG TPA: DUF3341 domain-containing protein, partial [Polyangiaceae bacterium]|nr:DUF3341 domain-containing protein [Polyangiaceae bacterium]
ELEDLLAPTRSNIPRTVLVAGICGAAIGLGVQWYCNALDFPINVGGRPPFGLPAFIPITFEIMVLLASLAAFFAVLRRARLPWLAHPVFEVPGFDRASVDRFWLFVSAEDPAYRGADETQALLCELGATSAFALPAGESPARSEDPALFRPKEVNS